MPIRSATANYNPQIVFSTYLFDVDGTLLDSIALISSALTHTLHAHHREVPADDAWRNSFGKPVRIHFAQVARDAAEVEAMVRTYRAYYAAYHDQSVRPYPGIKETIATLHEREATLAIVTSKGRQGTAQGLRTCALEEYFDVIVTADDMTEHKPHLARPSSKPSIACQRPVMGRCSSAIRRTTSSRGVLPVSARRRRCGVLSLENTSRRMSPTTGSPDRRRSSLLRSRAHLTYPELLR